MKQKLTSRVFPILCFVFLFTGCEDKLSPIDVSRLFWKGIEQRNITIIRKFASTDSHIDAASTENILPVSNILFGRTVIEGDRAWVDTTVTVTSDEPFALPLTTILVMENGYWKVNYDETVASISSGSDLARVMGSLRDLGGKFSEELDKSIDEVQKAVPQVKREIEKLEEEIRSRLPELRKRMEEFTKQLEDALKLPPEQPREQKEPVEI